MSSGGAGADDAVLSVDAAVPDLYRGGAPGSGYGWRGKAGVLRTGVLSTRPFVVSMLFHALVRPLGAAPTTPLPSCGDPARVRRRGQTAPAGGPGTSDTMARRWLGADDRPGRRASDITTRARREASAGRLAVETERPRALGRRVLPGARDARGSGA